MKGQCDEHGCNELLCGCDVDCLDDFDYKKYKIMINTLKEIYSFKKAAGYSPDSDFIMSIVRVTLEKVK